VFFRRAIGALRDAAGVLVKQRQHFRHVDNVHPRRDHFQNHFVVGGAKERRVKPADLAQGGRAEKLHAAGETIIHRLKRRVIGILHGAQQVRARKRVVGLARPADVAVNQTAILMPFERGGHHGEAVITNRVVGAQAGKIGGARERQPAIPRLGDFFARGANVADV